MQNVESTFRAEKAALEESLRDLRAESSGRIAELEKLFEKAEGDARAAEELRQHLAEELLDARSV